MPELTFRTTILAGETKNVAGIEIPPRVIEALGAGQRPRLLLDVNGYQYVSTVGKMAGKHMVGLSAEHRKKSGLAGGQHVVVRVSIATDEPEVVVPSELTLALRAARVSDTFARSAPSRRKEWVRQVLSARADETRERRISKIIAELKEK